MPVKNRIHRKRYRLQVKSLERHHSSSSSQEDTNLCHNSTEDSQDRYTKKNIGHNHHNARRTKIHLVLDQKVRGDKAVPKNK